MDTDNYWRSPRLHVYYLFDPNRHWNSPHGKQNRGHARLSNAAWTKPEEEKLLHCSITTREVLWSARLFIILSPLVTLCFVDCKFWLVCSRMMMHLYIVLWFYCGWVTYYCIYVCATVVFGYVGDTEEFLISDSSVNLCLMFSSLSVSFDSYVMCLSSFGTKVLRCISWLWFYKFYECMIYWYVTELLASWRLVLLF